MSYELVDDLDRQADARPDTPTLTDLPTQHPMSVRLTFKRPVKAATPKPEIMKRPNYLCPELGRTCHRPGAYDAYALPSLYDGVLKPYRFNDE